MGAMLNICTEYSSKMTLYEESMKPEILDGNPSWTFPNGNTVTISKLIARGKNAYIYDETGRVYHIKE